MEEVEIVEEERESRGSEVNAERETEREKRKLCQAVGSEQFLCLSTVSCVCLCVFSSAVRWGYPLPPPFPLYLTLLSSLRVFFTALHSHSINYEFVKCRLLQHAPFFHSPRYPLVSLHFLCLCLAQFK